MAIKLLISLFSQRIKCAFYCMLLLLLLLLPVLAFIKYWARLEQVKAGRQLLFGFGYLLPGLVCTLSSCSTTWLVAKICWPIIYVKCMQHFPADVAVVFAARRSRRILRIRPVAADAAAAYYVWHRVRDRKRGRTRVLDTFSLRTTGVSSLWHLKLPQKE